MRKITPEQWLELGALFLSALKHTLALIRKWQEIHAPPVQVEVGQPEQ